MEIQDRREVKISLIGGPFDGETLTGPWPAPYCLAATWHREEPVYRCTYCECCASELDELEYSFIGYKRVLEAEKKARNTEKAVAHETSHPKAAINSNKFCTNQKEESHASTTEIPQESASEN